MDFSQLSLCGSPRMYVGPALDLPLTGLQIIMLAEDLAHARLGPEDVSSHVRHHVAKPGAPRPAVAEDPDQTLRPDVPSYNTVVGRDSGLFA
jgi:hypothetical protein